MEGISIIEKYFPEITKVQRNQFSELGSVYREWNSKINVISRKDIEDLYLRHVLHSLGIAKYISLLPNTDVLDVGTGGGFPGIPMAILFPETNFTLVDSIGKKIRVVNEVTSHIDLKNVAAHHKRAESIDQQFDFVISRAVTKIGPFYQWIKKKFKKTSLHEVKNGVFYLKGGDLSEELKASKLRYKIFDLPEKFDEEFFETKKVLYVPQQ